MPTVNPHLIGRPAAYRVVGPAVVARRLSGVEAYIYRGGLVPADVDLAWVDSVLDQGLIEPLAGEA